MPDFKCTQNVSDLFLVKHRKQKRITKGKSNITFTHLVYTVLPFH